MGPQDCETTGPLSTDYGTTGGKAESRKQKAEMGGRRGSAGGLGEAGMKKGLRRGGVYCINATRESVSKAGLPPSGLAVSLCQGQRWILRSAPALMASQWPRRRCSWNLSPGELNSSASGSACFTLRLAR